MGGEDFAADEDTQDAEEEGGFRGGGVFDVVDDLLEGHGLTVVVNDVGYAEFHGHFEGH